MRWAASYSRVLLDRIIPGTVRPRFGPVFDLSPPPPPRGEFAKKDKKIISLVRARTRSSSTIFNTHTRGQGNLARHGSAIIDDVPLEKNCAKTSVGSRWMLLLLLASMDPDTAGPARLK